MERFCPYSQCSHLNILTFFPPDGGCSEDFDTFRFFFYNIVRFIFPCLLLSYLPLVLSSLSFSYILFVNRPPLPPTVQAVTIRYCCFLFFIWWGCSPRRALASRATCLHFFCFPPCISWLWVRAGSRPTCRYLVRTSSTTATPETPERNSPFSTGELAEHDTYSRYTARAPSYSYRGYCILYTVRSFSAALF